MTRLIATIAFAVCVAVSAIAGQDLSFVSHQLVAGRAKIAETGYIEKRSFGTARFSPELTIPVELIYDISSEKTGIFGFAWRSPQLESSAVWDKDGMLWTSPWGEKVKFFPKSEKTPKDL